MATGPDLIDLFRSNPVDMTPPYRWEDDVVYSWLSEGQREACIRANLIKDVSTASICAVAVTAGTSSYAISPLIVRVDTVLAAGTSGVAEKIGIYDRTEMDRVFPAWRITHGAPSGCIVEGNTLILNRLPVSNMTLSLEVFRLPLAGINDASPPEIPAIHHDGLVDWALYRAHLIEDDDEETPPGRWRKYLATFEAYFGRKPNADLKRRTVTNTPHSNKCWW